MTSCLLCSRSRYVSTWHDAGQSDLLCSYASPVGCHSRYGAQHTSRIPSVWVSFRIVWVCGRAGKWGCVGLRVGPDGDVLHPTALCLWLRVCLRHARFFRRSDRELTQTCDVVTGRGKRELECAWLRLSRLSDTSLSA